MGSSIRAGGGARTAPTTSIPGENSSQTQPDSAATTDATNGAIKGFAGGFLRNMMDKQKENAANLAKDPDDDS